jgi:hypothetical protein
MSPRPGPAALSLLLLAALAALPGAAVAQDESQPHHHEGPTDPLLKQVTLYLGADLALSPAGGANGSVAAPESTTDDGTPLTWSIKATHDWLLDSAVNVNVVATVENPTVSAGGPNGTSFKVQLGRNGQNVSGAEGFQRLDSALMQPGTDYLIKLFIPKVPLEVKAGDTVDFSLTFYGLNPGAAPTLHYTTGNASWIGFRLRYPGLDSLGHTGHNGAKHFPSAGYDFAALQRARPDAKVFTLKAFQFGFHGAPVVVDNNTHVILQLTIDESLSTAGEGHAGHEHGGGNGTWDFEPPSPLHGFSLSSLQPGLETALYDGEVVVLEFDVQQAGNYSFACIVYCGSGHAGMRDVLTVQGASPAPPAAEGGGGQAPAEKKTPGLEPLAMLAALGAAGLLHRRR